MDFGPAADDYARHRAGFPTSFFERVPLSGRVLDLGSGTGAIARSYRASGAQVVALDLSPAMLSRAPDLPARVAARAERCPFRDGSFDAVVAGQCWHWLDGPAAAREANRLLSPGGRLVVAHFDYLAIAPNAAFESERLVLEVHPAWPMAGSDGRYDRWRPHLEAAGLDEIESVDWVEDVVYTHESWRGRMRANNGVLALGDPARIAAFDAELGRLLARRFPDPLIIPHRVFVLSAKRSASARLA
ncbi:MAG: class I SAM-dependent methyltransferase [Deltaproteobacteria bacterium]|nr:class I SAM-dependent methyltransferase [Deltaproteobacteria bacterium]